LRGGYASGESSKSLRASGRRVNGAVHSTVAVRLPGAEEPDWAGCLGHLESKDTNLTASSVKWHKRRGEAILLCDGIELLCAWVGKGALGNGMVATAELKVDEIANSGGDNLRIKDETSGTVLACTDSDRDVGGEGGDDGTEDGESSSGKLHV